MWYTSFKRCDSAMIYTSLCYSINLTSRGVVDGLKVILFIRADVALDLVVVGGSSLTALLRAKLKDKEQDESYEAISVEDVSTSMIVE